MPIQISYSLRTVLFLLLLVVLVPALLIQSYIYYDRFQSRQERELQANLEVARATCRGFEAFVQGVLQQELAIGIAATASPPMQAADLKRLLKQSADSAPAVHDFFLVGPGGQILASSHPANIGMDISHRAYFTQIAAGRSWKVSDLLQSRIGSAPVFTISRGVRDSQGVFLGMVSASVLPDQLDRVLPIKRGGNAGISLIDSRGMLVFRYPEVPVGWEDRQWLQHHPDAKGAFQGQDIATILIMPPSGQRHLFGLSPVDATGWVSAANRSEEDALAPIYSALLKHAVSFLLVILAAFGTALALLRPIAASIDRLRTHALAMGRGEIAHLEAAAGPYELRELAEAFNRMAEKVRQREEALRENENRYRELVQNANSAIIRIRNDGTIVFFNEFAQSFYGYSAEEVQGKSIGLIIPDTDSTATDLAGILANPEKFYNHVNENVLRDGRRVWMAWTNRPIYDEQGRVVEILSIGSDITGLKRAEDARHETEERFRVVVHNLSEGLFIHARSGRVIYHNPASLRMHGFDDQWPTLTDGEAASIWEVTDLKGRIVPFEKWLHHRVLRGQQVQNAVARVRRKDGKRDFWASYSGVPLYGKDGQVKFALITMRDETARIRAEEDLRDINRKLEQIVQERTALLARTIDELKAANQQLDARASQLAALTGELTMAEQHERRRLAKILHDSLQQHLAATKMHLGGVTVSDDRGELRAALNEVEEMLAESIRMSRSLSADLSPPALHEGGLAAGLAWLARRMRERYAFQVELVTEGAPELPEDVKILVFESVRELLFNAFKHAHVNTARVLLQPVDGTGLTICVSDSGAGFDPDSLLASGESGGGFGLFSIRERIGLIGGTVKIDSAPGRGSCFTLSVPHSGMPSAAPDGAIPLPVEQGRHVLDSPGPLLRVLLADDHTLFRDGIARLLGKESDIAVVGEAKDGQEAVELSRRLSPHVILMDINMPVLNGIEATRIIHRESPSVRIIGLSMHEAEDRADMMRTAGAIGYKNKTCPVAELIAAVRDVVR